MEQLLVAKQQLTRFYTKFEAYIVPVLRFIAMLTALIFINTNVGFMSKLKNPAIVLIISLLASFLPTNVIIVLAGFVIVAHLYALSLNCAVVMMLILIIMYALYFRFTPRDAIAAIITPVACALHIPYVMPITMGFVGTPLSGISVGCGVAIYYMLEFVKENQDVLSDSSTLDPDGALSSFRAIIDGMIKNPTMMLVIAVFALTVAIVYGIRRLRINYSWQIALGVGIVFNILGLLIGSAVVNAEIGVLGVILGSIGSVIVVEILQFFVFNVDYSRAEYVQFEDDEYYYYVKAVPKITLEAPRANSNRRGGREDDEVIY